MINPYFVDTISLYRYKIISSFISKKLNEKYSKLDKNHFNHVKFKAIQHENFLTPAVINISGHQGYHQPVKRTI
jgi:hypothetical protein